MNHLAHVIDNTGHSSSNDSSVMHDVIFQSPSQDFICIEVPPQIALSDLDIHYEPTTDKLTLNDGIMQSIYAANERDQLHPDELRAFLVNWYTSIAMLNRPADKMRPFSQHENGFTELRRAVRRRG